MDDALCIYCTRTDNIIDYVRRSETSTTALTRLLPDYGSDLVAIPINEACARSDAARVTDPEEITKERFTDMLHIMPPVDWKGFGSTETFKLCEPVSGNVFNIYARIDERYFSFNDMFSITHTEICEKVRTSAAYFNSKEQRLS